MTNWEFIQLLSEQWKLYLIITIVSCLIYWFIFRKKIYNIFDPLFISLVGSVFGFSIVLYLYVTNTITFYFFSSYILTQCAFFTPLLAFNTRKTTKISGTKLKDESDIIRITFLVFTTLDCLFQLFVYKNAGIPLFMDSRLETFQGGTGFGIVSRFISVTRFFSIYYCILFIKSQNLFFKRYACVYLSITLFFTILSGSKSGILLYLHIMFCYFAVNKLPIKFFSSIKQVIAFGILLSFFVVFTLYIKFGNLSISILSFLERFVFYGDIYWQAYPNGTLADIQFEGNIFKAVFVDFLGSLRLVPWEKLPEPIGYTFHQFYEKTDLISGANARHNVLGLIYCGYFGSIFFSFILGSVLYWFRKKLINATNSNQIIKPCIAYFYVAVVALETDPTLSIGSFVSLLIIVLIVCFPILLIYYISKLKKYGNFNYNCKL